MMIQVYITCGEVLTNYEDACNAEDHAFDLWTTDDEMAIKLIEANEEDDEGRTFDVLRNYWDRRVNLDTRLDCIKVVAPVKECTVEVSRNDNERPDYSAICGLCGSVCSCNG